MTTTDPVLRKELALALEDESMSQVPSEELAQEIARCPACRDHGTADGAQHVKREALCTAHRAQWNLELCSGESEREVMNASFLESLMRTALSTEDGGTRFLSAYQRQARALQSVWEAHQRGAVHLPPGVADQVERARAAAPGFLSGTGSRARAELAR